MPNILFVCTGNTCRSPMAEHLLRKMAADRGVRNLTVESAGTSPATSLPLPKEAASALSAEGVGGVVHRAKGLDAAMVARADVILAMEPSHRDRVLARFPEAAGRIHVLKTYAALGGPDGIDDPYGGTEEDYRRALSEIKAALSKIVDNLKP